MSNGKNLSERKPIRWSPLILIVLVFVAGVVHTWWFADIYRQAKYLRIGKLFLITLGGFLFWLLFLSRVRKKTAFAIFGLIVLIGVTLGASLRITGVDGDLLPIVEFRWKAKRPALTQHTDTNIQASATQQLAANAQSQFSFPQFMGPDRTAVLKGPALATNWTERPPVELWRKPAGAAWSGFAIAPPYAITQEQHGEEERTIAYDLATGAIIWSHPDASQYNTVIAGEGPRSTPTIISNKVITYGAAGILNCLELTNGKPVWSTNVWKTAGKLPDWGVSCSPLIAGDKVVVTSPLNSSNLAAFHLNDGSKVWDANSRGADYSSPALFTLLGKEQIAHFNGKGISAFEPADGKLLWHYNWPGGHPHIALPVAVSPDQLVISSGYGTGAELIRLTRNEETWNAERVWKSMGLKSKFAPVVIHENHIYGLDDGIFTCLELSTGKRLWKDGRYGHGQFLLVKDLILMMAENGSVILIKPDPSGLIELGAHKVFAAKTWNPPALAGDLLLVRNDREIACLRLPLVK